MSDTITLAFNCALGVFVLFGILWGLIRGAKKTVSRLIFLLVTSIILVFVSSLITSLILKIPVEVSIVDENSETTMQRVSLLEYISIMIENALGENVTNAMGGAIDIVITLPMLLINIVIFLVLFWLLKYLLLPLNTLINKLIFRKKKNKEQFGFSEFHSSDDSSENKITPESAGMFIKKDNDIRKDAPTANAGRTKIVVTKISDDEDKKALKARKKEEKKLLKQERKSSKPKKYRLLGGVVGAFVGLVVTFNTMIPIYGFMNMLEEYKSVKISHLTEDELTLSSISNGITDDALKGYELSIIGRMSSALGLEKLGVTIFDTLSTAKVEDKEISLRKDLSAVVTTVEDVDSLVGTYKRATENGLENITQEDLTTLITGVDNLITQCQQVEFVNALSDYILPIAYEILVENDVKLFENENINQLVFSTIETLAEDAGIDIFAELKGIVNIAKYLDEQKVLLPLITNKTDNIIDVIHNIDDDFGSKLATKLFELKTIDKTFPDVLNIALTFFDDMTDFGYKENTASDEEIKTSFTQLLNNIVLTAKTVSDDSSIYVTVDTLIPLGKTLDTLRNSKLFNIDTYNNLVDYTISQVKLITADIIPENFKDFFNNKLLRNIEYVENWETEMTIITNSINILRDKDYGILGDVVEGKDLREGFNFNITMVDETFINIGKALDSLEASVLLGSNSTMKIDETSYDVTTLSSLVVSLIDQLNESLSSDDETITTILEITQDMKNNLISCNHKYSENQTFWEDEMTALSPLVIYISDIAETGEFEINTNLGTILDTCASDSVMLGGNTTLTLMEKLIGLVQDQMLGEDYTLANDDSLDDAIYTLFEDIKLSLQETDYTEGFWEHEIECFIAIKNIADKASSITTIAGAKELATDLDKIYTSRIIPAHSFNKTIAVVLRQLKTADTEGVSGKINELIEEIAIDISSATFLEDKSTDNFWTIELNYFDELNSIDFSDSEIKTKIGSIGVTLDNITTNTDTRASYLITELRLRKILSSAIDEMSSTIVSSFESDLGTSITTALEKISTNIYNSEETEQIDIVSFEFELTRLQTLANLDISSNLFTYTTQISMLEDRLQVLGANIDTICYNITTNENIISYNESLNSKIITRNIMGNIIASAFGTAKIDSPESTTETAFNTVIEDIQSSIENISTLDKVITWQRELSFVSSLIQLNNPDAEITLENATTTVAVYLDKIAFNRNGAYFADIAYNTDNNIVGEYILEKEISSGKTIYYNSVIISRSSLKNLVNSLVVDFKIEAPADSQDEIANELIDNLMTKVKVSDDDIEIKYTNYTEAFEDLDYVKQTMETTATNMDGKAADEITADEMLAIDEMLDEFQRTKISGVLTTRKIALMILDILEENVTQEIAASEAGLYFVSLQNHYNDNISSTTAEEYFTDTPTDGNTFANPFVTLQSKIPSE